MRAWKLAAALVIAFGLGGCIAELTRAYPLARLTEAPYAQTKCSDPIAIKNVFVSNVTIYPNDEFLFLNRRQFRFFKDVVNALGKGSGRSNDYRFGFGDSYEVQHLRSDGVRSDRHLATPNSYVVSGRLAKVCEHNAGAKTNSIFRFQNIGVVDANVGTKFAHTRVLLQIDRIPCDSDGIGISAQCVSDKNYGPKADASSENAEAGH